MEVELIGFSHVKDVDEWYDQPVPDQICNMAARTCVSEELPRMYYTEDTYFFWDDPDKKALKHAIASGHESVAEHASFTFAVSGVSRVLTHQLVRHRVASYSQQSQRYVNMDGFEYVTPDWIEQSWFDDTDDDGNGDWGYGRLKDLYDSEMERLARLYSLMVESGVPEEDARYILPNACTTNIVITMNARELRHFFALRCCNRAQWEIRELAEKMLELVKPVAPTLFENAGPSCVQLGYCPEKRSCGKCVTKDELLKHVESFKALKRLGEI